MAKWISAGKGVRFREHEFRKYKGQPDRYYTLRVKVDGKLVEEGLGWASAGWNLTKAVTEREKLKQAHRTGEGPATLAEKRELAREKRQDKAREKERAVTIEEFFTGRYLPWAKEHKKSWVDDLRYYRKHLEPRFGDKTFDAVSPLDVERMKLELKKGVNKRGVPYAAATIKHQIVILRRLYNLARKWGIYDGASPLDKVDMPKLDNQKTESLREDELSRLIETLESWPNQESAAFVKFALFTGLRRGELFKLTWDDVDFERSLVTLRKPKGGKTQTLPVSKEALEILNELDRRSSFVFPGKDGGQRTNFIGPWQRIREAAGLPKNFRLHGLRHAFASRLVSAGVDLYVVQALLTHKDAKTTQRYAHLSPGALKEAALNSGELLKPKVKEEEVIPIKA